ncbi:hypothetical protein AVR91_0206385 [Amycolatopsis keratiniphila subsp. keratiniphila]|uniref:HEAT repeat-containing protein n=1 Tax=Amycolatopsis keratiniphila subsp. keratiniphila TaxID=227715 RepID=A0A1W2M1Y3_9PSEU|nr:hypothetical protein AVR91_0206385 [Amycolatopsis keratiniphila subsp. keratiniphila]
MGAARERPERAAELVRPYIGASEEWHRRLRVMVEWSLSPGLVDLTVQLLERGAIDGARGPIAVNSDFWSIIAGLKEDDPAGAARIVGAYLDRARVRSRADGVLNPFSDYVDQSSGSGGETTIIEIATAAPEQFLDSVLPFVLAILNDTAGDRMEDGLWTYRFSGSHQIDGAVLDGIDIALCASAPRLWADGSRTIRDLTSIDHEVAWFLACRAYTAIADLAADVAIDWLLSDDRYLNLGWRDSRSWASRQLVEAASKRCQDARLIALCTRLLDYYPVWEKTAEGRSARGYSQYELLSALPADRLPLTARRRLNELERKFPEFLPRPPKPLEAQFVGSPVPEAAGEYMTDSDWINAIARYRIGQDRDLRTFGKGGTTELARMLGRRAEAEPERFAALALTFDAHTPTAHITEVINAVVGKIDIALFTRLCQHAHRIADAAVGRTVCSAIAKIAADADDALVSLLEHYAHADDPEQELTAMFRSRRTDEERDLATEGLNSTRGLAAEAIGHVVFAQHNHGSRLVSTIRRLARDPILSVQAQAAQPVLALFNIDLDQALHIADDMFTTAPVEITYSNAVNRLLKYAIYRDGDRFARHLNRTLEAVDHFAVRAGHIWANALLNDLLPAACPAVPDALPEAARQGAAATIASAPHLATDILIDLFDDQSPRVRKAASAAVRSLHEIDTARAERILAAFTVSPAFPENFEGLFRSLERSQRHLPPATISACERAVAQAGPDLGDLRTAHVATSRSIVTLVLRLYRQGDAAMRARCLNVIDQLSDLGAYGLSEALQHER